MDLSSFVVDFVGFYRSADDFIFKEVTILPLEEDSTPSFFYFKPPTPWENLSNVEKGLFFWLERNFHGLRYSSGIIDYTHLKETFETFLKNAEKIYVKSLEKKRFLEDLLPHK